MSNKLRDKAEAVVAELDEMDLVEFHEQLCGLAYGRHSVRLLSVNAEGDLGVLEGEVESLEKDLADTENEVFKLLNTIEDLLIEVERLEEIIDQLHAEKET